MTHDENSHRAVPAGTTVRLYDPKIRAWHRIWIAPSGNVVQGFIARRIKAEIVLEGRTEEGYPERWVFSEITHTSFRWRSEETHDHGKTWILTAEMQARRRGKEGQPPNAG